MTNKMLLTYIDILSNKILLTKCMMTEKRNDLPGFEHYFGMIDDLNQVYNALFVIDLTLKGDNEVEINKNDITDLENKIYYYSNNTKDTSTYNTSEVIAAQLKVLKSLSKQCESAMLDLLPNTSQNVYKYMRLLIDLFYQMSRYEETE